MSNNFLDLIKGEKLQALTLIIVLMLAVGLANKYLETDIDVSDIADLYEEIQTKIDTLNGTLQTTINSTFYNIQKPYSYIVGSVDSGGTTYYTLQNGATGSLEWYSTNKTAVQEAATGNLTSGGSIYLKGVEWDTNLSYTDISIVEDYQGTVNYYGADSFWFEGDNRTDVLANPQEAWSYLIYVDPNNSSVYKAKASNGTICWESTNITSVHVSAQNDLSTGGTIFYNTGTYSVSTIIPWKTNINIEGNGKSTIFSLADDLDSVFKTEEGNYSGSIKNVRITGNKASRSSGSAIHLYRSYRYCIENVYIDSFKECGIKIEGSSGQYSYAHKIDKCDIMLCDSDGIYSMGYSTDLLISNNEIGNNGRYGYNEASGMNNLVNNHIWGSTNHQIYLSSSLATSIISNNIEDGGADGIRVYNYDNLQIESNIIRDHGGSGIYISGDCSTTKIFGNSIINATQYGIANLNTADYTTCVGNDIDAGWQKWQNAAKTTHNIVVNNDGFNPVGVIANPIVTGEAVLLNAGGNDTIADNTTYTNIDSPKAVYMQDADTFDVYHNGQLVADDVNQYSLVLQPSDTFKIDWTNTLTILKFVGQ